MFARIFFEVRSPGPLDFRDLALAAGGEVIECPSPLNVLDDTYDRSCDCARSDAYQRLISAVDDFTAHGYLAFALGIPIGGLSTAPPAIGDDPVVRKMPSWPRSWASFSLSSSCIPTGMHGQAWAN
jgi:hypothetical protein